MKNKNHNRITTIRERTQAKSCAEGFKQGGGAVGVRTRGLILPHIGQQIEIIQRETRKDLHLLHLLHLALFKDMCWGL